MHYLRYSAYFAFAMGGISVIGALAAETFILLGGAVWATLIGVALLAASEAMGYLVEIRDEICGAGDRRLPTAEGTSSQGIPDTPPRSLEEISKDLEEMKKRQ